MVIPYVLFRDRARSVLISKLLVKAVFVDSSSQSNAFCLISPTRRVCKTWRARKSRRQDTEKSAPMRKCG